jgi:hypothetical protein
LACVSVAGREGGGARVRGRCGCSSARSSNLGG